jgi:type I restriction enzyme S subunit
MPDICAQIEFEPLGRLADIRVSNVDKKTVAGELPVRLCNYTDVYKADYLTASHSYMHASATHAEIQRFAVQANDVIITKDSETPYDIGVAVVIDEAAPDMVCGYHLAMIRPSVALNPVWLAKQFGHARLQRHLSRVAAGTTRYGLSNGAIANLPIFVPTRNQQDFAASVFRTLDETIRKTEQLIAKLQLAKDGLLHDLLTRGIDDNGELRDPKRHSEQFKNSALGKIPVAWQSTKLGKLVSQDRPIAYGILMPGRGYPGGVPVIKVKDIYDGCIDETDLLLTSPALDYEYRRSRLIEGDLLFTIRGSVGRMAIVPSSLGGANITQDTARIGLVGAHASFVRHYLEMPTPKRFVEVHTIGQAVKGINLGELRKVPLVLPPLDEQVAIARQIDTSVARIDCEAKVVLKLSAIKRGLMDDLLTGRVRVNA